MKRWSFLFVAGLVGAFCGAVVATAAWGSPAAQNPPIPHAVVGREACLTCHATGEKAVPADHAGRAESTCLLCHQPAAAPSAGGTATVSATLTPTAALPTAVAPTAAPTLGLPTPAPVLPSEYKGPEFCQQCHVPHYQEWQNSTHALAFEDAVFQESWAENRKPGYCLACHATGYNPNTGLPVAEGVTCESCHGTYREGHPATDMMPVDPAAERCGQCHTTTYQEWQLSGHAQRSVKCASCHAVHSQGLLFATATALCATCHGDRAEDYAHAAHATSGVICSDCHMYRPPNGEKVEGLNPTGHFFSVESQACTVCHTRDSIHSRRQTFEPQPAVDVALVQRVSGLEKQVDELNAGATRNLILGLVGGAAIGMVLGGVAMLLLSRRLPGGERGAQDNS